MWSLRMLRALGFLVLTVFFGGVLPVASPAQECSHFESDMYVAGHAELPSSLRDVVVSGSYAYVADYLLGLQVIDVSNPSAPALIAGLDTPGSAEGVAVSGDYALIAAGDVYIIDVSNPASPFLAKTLATAGDATALVVQGDDAFVACRTGGLVVIDISNPPTATVVATLPTMYPSTDVAVAGDYAYVTEWLDAGPEAWGYDRIEVVDVGSPSSPSIVWARQPTGAPMSIVVSGGFAYVGIGAVDMYDNSGFEVYNLADPTRPIWTGIIWMEDYPADLCAVGTWVYAETPHDGLLVIDASIPSRPAVRKTFAGITGFGVATNGSDVFAGRGSAIYVVCGDPAGLVAPLGSAYAYCVMNRTALAGNYALVPDQCDGLLVIDVSSPALPTIVGTCNAPQYASAVAVQGSYAYVADMDTGLRIIDVSTPQSPTAVGWVDTPGYAYDVAVDDTVAYVADDATGFKVIDVSDPSAPAIIGNVDTPGHARGVATYQSCVLVADDTYGVQVVDVSDPATPHIIGVADTPGNARSVAITGHYALVADGGAGLRILDLSSPSAPSLVKAVDTPGSAVQVSVAGNTAYIADFSSRTVIAVDITDPAAAFIVGSASLPEWVYGVTATEDYVYATVDRSGLYVLPTQCPEQISVEPRIPPFAGLMLLPPRPNPAGSSVTFGFETPGEQPLTIQVFDVAGRRVRDLWHRRNSGLGSVGWDLRDESGRAVGSGVYLIRMISISGCAVQRLTVVR